jgi:hypothetical protein
MDSVGTAVELRALWLRSCASLSLLHLRDSFFGNAGPG